MGLAAARKPPAEPPSALPSVLGDDVDLDARPGRRAAALGTNKAGGMTVIDHDHCIVAVGKSADFNELGEIAVHGKDPVRHDDDTAGVVLAGGFKLFLQVVHVAIGEAVALCLRQAYAVDDRGMVETVGHDGVIVAEQGLEGAAIGIEAGGIKNGVLHAEIGGDDAFQLTVQIGRSADETHRSHAETVGIERGLGRGYQLGMIGKVEIVVGAQVQYLPGLPPGRDLDVRRLGRKDRPFGLPKVLSANGFELG